MISVKTNGSPARRKPAVLPDVSAMAARIAELEAMLASSNRATVRWGKKRGVIAVAGVRRFPISYYRNEWRKIIELVPQIESFMAEHADELDTIQREYESGKSVRDDS